MGSENVPKKEELKLGIIGCKIVILKIEIFDYSFKIKWYRLEKFKTRLITKMKNQ